MRISKGYVFVGNFKDFEHLFGASKTKGWKYENLQSNGLQTFQDRSSAEKGIKVFLEKIKEANYAQIGYMNMQLAENSEELETFRRKSGLIVLMGPDDLDDEVLLGPCLDGKRDFYPIPAAHLKDNGFVAYTHKNSQNGITPFERALYVASEVRRQGQCPARIGSFKLRRFKKIFRAQN